jgi:hypothetical protein
MGALRQRNMGAERSGDVGVLEQITWVQVQLLAEATEWPRRYPKSD